MGLEKKIMKIYPDNKLIKKLKSLVDKKEITFFFNEYVKKKFPHDGKPLQFMLEWPLLLEYLDLSLLFDPFPKLDVQNKIFSSVIEVLKLDSDKDVIVYLYDQIFVECLTQVKALPQVNFQTLIDQIHFAWANPLFPQDEDPFAAALDSYEKRLTENPYDTIHDLILYLAWDRVCVYLGTIFDDTTLKISNGLEILKECLIESFWHITEQGRTTPSLFRLVEALFAYEMKEENFQCHSEREWQVLCQGAVTLQSHDDLINVSYLDSGVSAGGQAEKSLLTVFTLESVDKVKARMALIDYIGAKLKKEAPDYQFALSPFEIHCLKESKKAFLVEEVIHTQRYLA